jgi:hypothetical protein
MQWQLATWKPGPPVSPGQFLRINSNLQNITTPKLIHTAELFKDWSVDECQWDTWCYCNCSCNLFHIQVDPKTGQIQPLHIECIINQKMFQIFTGTSQ